ncbi:helix-turn-helix domain-containing protein [Streptosporangium sandarakinum]|uniref:helix-turn-helix domain-containing protein n=1 Tax=Streptosporangium sandarakinum TaxID=1260955 RepID=UPI0037125E05
MDDRVLIPWWPDAARLLGGLSRSKTHELVRSGDLPSVRVGGRRLVLAEGLREYVARLSREQAMERPVREQAMEGKSA